MKTEKDKVTIKIPRPLYEDVMIRLEAPAVVDPFNHIPEMGRFVLEKEGRPMAGGIIL